MINYIQKLLITLINQVTANENNKLLKSSEFKSLHKKYGFKSEGEWVEVARKTLKEDPDRFIKIMDYDVRNGKFRKYY